MLLDSAHIQEVDAENISYKNAKRGLPPVEPLYSIADAAEVAQLFVPKPYEKRFKVAPGVTATLVDAGHILGSAAVMLDIKDKTSEEKRSSCELPPRRQAWRGRWRRRQPTAAAAACSARRPRGRVLVPRPRGPGFHR